MAEQFTLPTSGEVVSLRGLTGFEVMLARKKHRDDEIALNAMMLGFAMDTDEAAALAWLKGHLAGDAVAAIDRAQELSGLSEDAAKSGVPSDGGRPE